MDFDNLNALKGELINRNADTPYAIAISKIVVDLMPESCKEKLLVMNEEDANNPLKITPDVAISYLATILPTVVSEAEFRAMISKSKDEMREDLEQLMRLCQLEAFLDESKAVQVQMISEAESPEEAKDITAKTFTDVVGEVKTPNIISVISKTITKELQKSNEQLEKIEKTEDELILNTDPDLDPEGNVKGSDGDDNNPDTPDNKGTDPNNPNPDTTQANGVPEGEETKVTIETEPVTGFEGEEGELYNEAMRTKYAESLNDNLVYQVKNTVSKYVYSLIADKNNGEGLSERERIMVTITVYGLCTFGYLLDKCDLMDTDDFINRIKSKMVYTGNESIGSDGE